MAKSTKQLLEKWAARTYELLSAFMTRPQRPQMNDQGRFELQSIIEQVRLEALAEDALELRPLSVMLFPSGQVITVLRDATEEERWLHIQTLLDQFSVSEVMREVARVWPDYGGLH